MVLHRAVVARTDEGGGSVLLRLSVNCRFELWAEIRHVVLGTAVPIGAPMTPDAPSPNSWQVRHQNGSACCAADTSCPRFAEHRRFSKPLLPLWSPPGCGSCPVIVGLGGRTAVGSAGDSAQIWRPSLVFGGDPLRIRSERPKPACLVCDAPARKRHALAHNHPACEPATAPCATAHAIAATTAVRKRPETKAATARGPSTSAAVQPAPGHRTKEAGRTGRRS